MFVQEEVVESAYYVTKDICFFAKHFSVQAIIQGPQTKLNGIRFSEIGFSIQKVVHSAWFINCY